MTTMHNQSVINNCCSVVVAGSWCIGIWQNLCPKPTVNIKDMQVIQRPFAIPTSKDKEVSFNDVTGMGCARPWTALRLRYCPECVHCLDYPLSGTIIMSAPRVLVACCV
eukprot:gnl/MRDRNA2_/MRDRNA2_252193_c0_seq1.p1 gnl/MRDRNA2_/MRDRNA2_252193_c0~~gnl/MRDRNA2_/MRDRNA2_252193_c0_seq1.p1  ORF type:complete len:119 (-),score=8.22 gnl/MRDRNA2_/MRDRNA2_252193_c0_seq1:18-344(-)